MRRDDHIDVLRGVAILLILILHAGALAPGLEDRRYLQIVVGRMGSGMQLFFVLSGYLIARSWEETRRSSNALSIFAIKRIGKIVPLYLLFLHLNIFAFLWIDAIDPSYVPMRNSVSRENLTALNYVAHLLFVQGVVPAWLHTLVDGSWSIAAEVYFYILFPVLLSRRCESVHAAFKSYVITLGIAVLTTELIGGRLPGSYGYYNFAAQLPCFMLGVLAFRILQDPLSRVWLTKWAPTLLTLVLLLAVGMVNGNLSPIGVHNLYRALFATALVSFACLPARDLLVARMNFLRILGQQTYALYFSHLLLLKLQHYVLVERMNMTDFWILLSLNLVTSVAASLVLSSIVLHPIDQYFVSLSSRISNRLRNQVPSRTVE